jgi:hypothetical protein
MQIYIEYNSWHNRRSLIRWLLFTSTESFPTIPIINFRILSGYLTKNLLVTKTTPNNKVMKKKDLVLISMFIASRHYFLIIYHMKRQSKFYWSIFLSTKWRKSSFWLCFLCFNRVLYLFLKTMQSLLPIYWNCCKNIS